MDLECIKPSLQLWVCCDPKTGLKDILLSPSAGLTVLKSPVVGTLPMLTPVPLAASVAAPMSPASMVVKGLRCEAGTAPLWLLWDRGCEESRGSANAGDESALGCLLSCWTVCCASAPLLHTVSNGVVEVFRRCAAPEELPDPSRGAAAAGAAVEGLWMVSKGS